VWEKQGSHRTWAITMMDLVYNKVGGESSETMCGGYQPKQKNDNCKKQIH
jgi:hypothetical protein